MATYPSIGRRTTKRPANNGVVPDRSDAGTVRIADTSADDLYEITIEHPLMDSTDRATFWTFFDTYRRSSNAITIGSDTYNAYFSAVPSETQDTPTRWTITATMVGNKA